MGGCHQVNSGVDNWIMPDLTYHVALNDLNVELIAMDTNVDWLGEICTWLSCESECYARLTARAAQAVEYFIKRYEESEAKTFITFSHYPVDYLGPQPKFLKLLKDNSKHDIVYFGGHRHATSSSGPAIAPNTAWLVGGGGGYGCDGSQQGYVKGFIYADGTVTTEEQLVPTGDCCYFGSRESSVPHGASFEAITCSGGSCSTSTLAQGVPVKINGTNLIMKGHCETSSHLKVDVHDADTDDLVAWHFVPQNTAVPAVHNVADTVEFRCDKADSVPTGWSHPDSVSGPLDVLPVKTFGFASQTVWV